MKIISFTDAIYCYYGQIDITNRMKLNISFKQILKEAAPVLLWRHCIFSCMRNGVQKITVIENHNIFTVHEEICDSVFYGSQ